MYVDLVWVWCGCFQKIVWHVGEADWLHRRSADQGSQVGMVAGRRVHTQGWHLVSDINCWCVWFARVLPGMVGGGEECL